MASEKRVRDIMGFSSVIEVDRESSVKNLVTTSLPALKSGYNPTILVKDENSIVGMLSWDDLLYALVPSYAKGYWKMEIFWEGLFIDQWKNIADCKVKDLMRPPIAVNIDDTLAKVAYTLVNSKVSSVLVNDRGKMVGMISTGDLFTHLASCSSVQLENYDQKAVV